MTRIMSPKGRRYTPAIKKSYPYNRQSISNQEKHSKAETVIYYVSMVEDPEGEWVKWEEVAQVKDFLQVLRSDEANKIILEIIDDALDYVSKENANLLRHGNQDQKEL